MKDNSELLFRAAGREIREKGFRGAALDAILAETGLTREALAHAVVEKVIRAEILEIWVRPLIGTEDPIRTILGIFRGLSEQNFDSSGGMGCPLHSFSREMSPLDETLRSEIAEIYRLWRGAIAEALERGILAGSVRMDVNARAAAAFLVASFEGIFGMAAQARDSSVLSAAGAGLRSYLEGLRA